jgi:hypothetical protein
MNRFVASYVSGCLLSMPIFAAAIGRYMELGFRYRH